MNPAQPFVFPRANVPSMPIEEARRLTRAFKFGLTDEAKDKFAVGDVVAFKLTHATVAIGEISTVTRTGELLVRLFTGTYPGPYIRWCPTARQNIKSVSHSVVLVALGKAETKNLFSEGLLLIEPFCKAIERKFPHVIV